MTNIYRHTLASVLAVLLLAACENEAPDLMSVKVFPTFSATIEGVKTKAFDTSWDKGDQIGIFGGSKTNIRYETIDGDGHFTAIDSKNQFVFEDNDRIQFFAYYPYKSLSTSGTNKGKIINISTATQANQKNFDFLWAEAYGSKVDSEVKFKFSHVMSKITLIFINGDGVDVSKITSYKLDKLIVSGGVFDPTSGICSSTNSTSSITVSNLTGVENGMPVTPCIVIPQTLTTNPMPLAITASEAGAGTLTCGLTFENNMIEAGKNYQFKITLSKIGLIVNSATIVDWLPNDLGNFDAY